LKHLPADETSTSEPEHALGDSSHSKIRVAADVKNLAEIRGFVEAAAESMQVDSVTVGEVVLAVDEAASNIILHGYQGQPGFIEIVVERQGNSLLVHLYDQAPPFDPTKVSAPDLTLPLEERPVGKLGVFLITQFMDDVIYNASPQGGNQLTLVKKIL
jgi:serine/threonine-protein kinase RsbW